MLGSVYSSYPLITAQHTTFLHSSHSCSQATREAAEAEGSLKATSHPDEAEQVHQIQANISAATSADDFSTIADECTRLANVLSRLGGRNKAVGKLKSVSKTMKSAALVAPNASVAAAPKENSGAASKAADEAAGCSLDEAMDLAGVTMAVCGLSCCVCWQ